MNRKYNDVVIHRMFLKINKIRILISTKHILDENDLLKKLKATMCNMCNLRIMLIYKHKFKHKILTCFLIDLEKIKEIIKKTIIRSKFI